MKQGTYPFKSVHIHKVIDVNRNVHVFFNSIHLVYFAAMPKRIENARIACLDFSLQKAKMHLGVSVVVEDPAQLEAIRKRYG